MSHFTVAVITRDKPVNGVLEAALQPFHEYECTGTKDQYVVEVDKTDDTLEEFNSPQKVIVLTDGTVHSRWDDRFYTVPPLKTWDRKGFALPDGAMEHEMSADEARKHGVGYATLEDCAREYCGGFVRNGRVYDWTNPNAKWDWWQIGGRWQGRLKALSLTCHATERIVGKRSLLDDDQTPHDCDALRFMDINWNKMKKKAISDRHGVWMKVIQRAAERNLETEDVALDTIRLRFGKLDATWHDEFMKSPEPRDRQAFLQQHFGDLHPYFEVFYDFGPIVDLDTPLRDWINSPPVLTTFALLTEDGQWYERGKMGCWACVSNEKAEKVWETEYAALLDRYIKDHPDYWLTIVDCHI